MQLGGFAGVLVCFAFVLDGLFSTPLFGVTRWRDTLLAALGAVACYAIRGLLWARDAGNYDVHDRMFAVGLRLSRLRLPGPRSLDRDWCGLGPA